jgi:hypothetical protein
MTQFVRPQPGDSVNAKIQVFGFRDTSTRTIRGAVERVGGDRAIVRENGGGLHNVRLSDVTIVN